MLFMHHHRKESHLSIVGQIQIVDPWMYIKYTSNATWVLINIIEFIFAQNKPSILSFGINKTLIISISEKMNRLIEKFDVLIQKEFVTFVSHISRTFSSILSTQIK